MNRNEETHFASAPVNLDIHRSTFDRSHQHKTTMNAGRLVPIFVDEVLPGDTFKLDMSSIVRMATPIFPVMDNAYMDTYFYFVPNRIVWEHWNEFNGENKMTAWEQTTEYEIPQITAPTEGWAKGTIADHMGMPIGKSGISVSHLPIRAYVKIWNEWFRDQNLQDPAYLNTDETTITGVNTDVYQTDAQKAGGCLKVNKYHDYFTSCLPAPQKGPAVLLPLGDDAPLTGDIGIYGLANVNGLGVQGGSSAAALSTVIDSNGINIGGTGWGGSLYAQSKDGSTHSPSAGNYPAINVDGSNFNTNLYNASADLSNATSATINELRQAFQIQRLYERDARGGTRYTEIIRSHFGVTSPDARQQRPEYLGGKRVPINIAQVLQTSSTDSTSPQGNTAAFSLTGDRNNAFIKSFTEHGYIIDRSSLHKNRAYLSTGHRTYVEPEEAF